MYIYIYTNILYDYDYNFAKLFYILIYNTIDTKINSRINSLKIVIYQCRYKQVRQPDTLFMNANVHPLSIIVLYHISSLKCEDNTFKLCLQYNGCDLLISVIRTDFITRYTIIKLLSCLNHDVKDLVCVSTLLIFVSNFVSG